MAITTSTVTPRSATSLLRATLTVAVGAAVATTAVAAVLHAAGVSFDVDGEIPLAAFAQMTALGTLIGGGLVALLNRRSTEPHRRFLQVTTALVVLSCIPSVALPHAVGTKLALVATHLVAAAIVVPVLARHTAD